jgi:hypothetical protein
MCTPGRCSNSGATVPNVFPMDEHTPVHGLPLERDEMRRTAHPGASQIAALEFADSHDAAPVRRGLPTWLLVLSLIGASGGGGSVVAGIGVLSDDDGAVRAITQDNEVQDRRLDGHDTAMEKLRSEQINQHRWVANEMLKQSRALVRIAEKVGAVVDVDVDPYQSGGL